MNDETQQIPIQKKVNANSKHGGNLAALVGLLVAIIIIVAIGAILWAVFWYTTKMLLPFLDATFPRPLYAGAFLAAFFVAGVLLRPSLEKLGRGKN